MKEPEISVGIVNAQEIHFSLNGNFFAKGETVCGEQQVAFSEGGILWNGNLYRELTFTPQDEHASFSLYDVTIGINFHWERQETQSFMGTLKLVVDEGKITAINILPAEDLFDKRHLFGDERHLLFRVSESTCRGITQLAVCSNRETQSFKWQK